MDLDESILGFLCVLGLAIDAALLRLLVRPSTIGPTLRLDRRHVAVRSSPFVVSSDPESAHLLVPEAEDGNVSVHVLLSDEGHWQVRSVGRASVELKGRPLRRTMRLFDGNELKVGDGSIYFHDPHCVPVSPSIPGYRLKGRPFQGGTSLLFPGRAAGGARVLVKVRDPSLDDAGRDATNARVEAEFQFLSLVGRPKPSLRFPRPYALLEDDDGFKTIVMEHVGGPTLRRTMDRRRLTARDVVRLGIGLTRTLDHLERLAVVHGDLKPSNVVLRDSRCEEPCLVDFGIAVASGSRIDGGTPHYRSPEHGLDSARPLSPKSDVFVLGILLRAVLASCRAETDGPARLRRDALWDLTARMMADRPEDRPSAMEAYDSLSRLDPA